MRHSIVVAMLACLLGWPVQAVTAAAQDPLSNWLNVGAVGPGSDVILIVAGRAAEKHRLLGADETGVTILDVSDPSLPSKVSNGLFAEANFHADRLMTARSRDVMIRNSLRIGPRGVFLEGGQVCELSKVVVRVPKADVDELRVLQKHPRGHLARGPLIGALVGALFLLAADQANAPDADLILGGVSGAAIGTGVAGIAIAVAPRHPDLVYRRPMTEAQ